MVIKNANQNETRERLLNYINQRGGKYVFVASKIGVDASVMSRFRHGANLWDDSLEKLNSFLLSEGF